VSVDGLNPKALKRLGPARTPTFHRLMRQGAFTLNARTVYEATLTLPNHASMLSGRRVLARKGGHGLTRNVDVGGTVHRTAGEYVASVFDVVHDHGGSTSLYAGKDKFLLFERTWNRQGAPDTTGADDGRAKIDRFTWRVRDRALVKRFASEMRSAPSTFSFLHLARPDVVGHRAGFMSGAYLRAVEQTDRRLARVMRTIESPAMAGRTTLLVTADHGGKRSHLDPTKRYAYTVPFFAWGPGVPAGAGLYGMNPAFKSPGRKRVGYARSRQPIRNGLVVNLSTGLLGLPAVSGSTLDPQQRFSVTR
ncbi:alkaline phosphatase family protein, partial [Nocardioides sp.]|uniref:alkaline phosphatase family protein n=1 Tax=Nocardioides sp. TaxID=35761 RepID=UPI0027340A16